METGLEESGEDPGRLLAVGSWQLFMEEPMVVMGRSGWGCGWWRSGQILEGFYK